MKLQKKLKVLMNNYNLIIIIRIKKLEKKFKVIIFYIFQLSQINLSNKIILLNPCKIKLLILNICKNQQHKKLKTKKVINVNKNNLLFIKR